MNDENKVKAEAITRFAEKLIKYYTVSVKGNTLGCMVAYYIEEKLKDELRRLEDEKDTNTGA